MGYIFSPIVLVLAVVTIVSVFLGLRQAKSILPASGIATAGKRAPLVFLVLITAYMAVALVDAALITNATDKLFPVAVAGCGLLSCLALLWRSRSVTADDTLFADREAGGEDAQAPHALWPTLAWFALLLGLASLLGFILALAIFLMLFMHLRAQQSWLRASIFTAAGIGFMLLMASLLNRDFPPGLLQSLIDLPWPLR